MMKNIKIDDIKVSSKLDDVIEKSLNDGYEGINNKKKSKVSKGVLVAIIAIGLIFTIGFGDQVIATMKLAMINIEKYLGNSNDLEDYKEVINTSVTKNGVTIQLNEVILDYDELIMSVTVRKDSSLDSLDYIEWYKYDSSLYINGKKIDGHRGYSTSSTDEYTLQHIFMYTLDEDFLTEDFLNEDMDIVLNLRGANIVSGDKKKFIRGPWKFKFKINSSALNRDTKIIKLDKLIELDNGDRIILNQYRSNLLGVTIYASMYSENYHDYSLKLIGYDDLGNKVVMDRSLADGKMNKAEFKNSTNISDDASTLILRAYILPNSKFLEEEVPEYEPVGEKFTINLKK